MVGGFPEEQVDDADTVQNAPVRYVMPVGSDEDATLSFPEFKPPPMPERRRKRAWVHWLRSWFRASS